MYNRQLEYAWKSNPGHPKVQQVTRVISAWVAGLGEFPSALVVPASVLPASWSADPLDVPSVVLGPL